MSPGGDKSGCATSMAKGRKPKLLLKKISVMKKGILNFRRAEMGKTKGNLCTGRQVRKGE